ncbi:MAG: hypothetical protein ACI9LM_001648 [Alteromonadaceae bacterium]|jgi:hypothetical protein
MKQTEIVKHLRFVHFSLVVFCSVFLLFLFTDTPARELDNT